MSRDITGIITWLRGWLDDIYSSISHSHGNLTNDGKISSSYSSTCNYFVGLDTNNKAYKCNALYSSKIKNSSALSNIGTSSNATQSSINSSINTKLGNKADKNHTHDMTSMTGLLDIVYPVGSIYMSVNDVDPATFFGGTWERIKDKFLLSKGDTYTTNGATGGEANHTLNINEMPSHNHQMNQWTMIVSAGGNSGIYTYYPSGTGKIGCIAKDDRDYATRMSNPTGGGQAHNNMPPYLVVNVWKRTA